MSVSLRTVPTPLDPFLLPVHLYCLVILIGLPPAVEEVPVMEGGNRMSNLIQRVNLKNIL